MPLSFVLQHGFARNVDWSLVGSENSEEKPVVTFELKDNSYSRAMWDFSFHALYKVSSAIEKKMMAQGNRVISFSVLIYIHRFFVKC